jgi:thiol-disulfide isomerase/thioredoxin
LDLLRQYRCGEGAAAQNSSTMLIGIGANESAESVTVTWPSGARQEARDVEAGDLLTFAETSKDISRDRYLAPPRQAPRDKPKLAGVPVFPAVKSTRGDQGLRLYTTMATWCASCKSHLPEIGQLRESFDESSLALYGLPVDDTDDSAKLKEYLKTFKPAYHLLSEMSSAERARVKELLSQVDALEALPSTVVTDEKGNVLLALPGLPTVSQLRALGPSSTAKPGAP